jgi:hypothetical protein
MEKAEIKEKERLKEEARKVKYLKKFYFQYGLFHLAKTTGIKF